MNYKDLIDLGMKRTDYLDNISFNQTGHNPFYLELKLSKDIQLVYNSDSSMGLRMIRTTKDEAILGTIRITSIDDAKMYVEFFTCTKSQVDRNLEHLQKFA